MVRYAPGWPGISPRWTSSAKDLVGTALAATSRVWFTVSHGILNEVYYPHLDTACTRDLGLLVADGRGFVSEEKRQSRSEVSYPVDGVPTCLVTNTCSEGRYRIDKDIVADPLRDVVLQRVRFTPLEGALSDYAVYVLLAPHLANHGAGNTAWVGDYKGVPMLFAERDGHALALASSAPWVLRSAGFVGVSDGWRDVMAHGRMTWAYERAENGNVALMGEADVTSCGGSFVLALGFASGWALAGQRALASLYDGFDAAHGEYVRRWDQWQRALAMPPEPPGERHLDRVSAAVLRTHAAKTPSAGMIASLSVPWGSSKGDDDLGGYHLVWPRDMVEAAGGLLAVGAAQEVREALAYLRITQQADGGWPQNMWLDGMPFWTGVQMDEAALPILLVDLARREGALEDADVEALWPMVRRAAGFVVRNGPVTQQDRWEEDPGYSPFTLAAEIAGLLVGAELAQTHGEAGVAAFLRETADAWNASIERWTYTTGTDLARRVGVHGYYVRIGPDDAGEAASPLGGFVPIKNRPPGQSAAPAMEIVSPDALALVRFGLRAADDPRIVDTVRVIDALLRLETPNGTAWKRYPRDGYGEHEDGSPFDGTGVGRAWPLLAGERGHYELAAGQPERAAELAGAMVAFASAGGMIPEQIWDSAPLPERELYPGRPSGSAMPLVWAHAEYLKLRRSVAEGRVFDMPPQTYERYVARRTGARHVVWRFNHKCRGIPAGRVLRVETLAPAVVRWGVDGWQSVRDTATRDTGLGVHVADLPIEGSRPGTRVSFTFRWPQAGRWEGTDYEVRVGEPEQGNNSDP